MTLKELTPEAIDERVERIIGVDGIVYPEDLGKFAGEVKALLEKGTIKTTGDIRIMSDEVDSNWQQKWLLLDSKQQKGEIENEY